MGKVAFTFDASEAAEDVMLRLIETISRAKAEAKRKAGPSRKTENAHLSANAAATLMKEQEVAGMIGMSVHWLRRKRWTGGGIPYVQLSSGGAVRYREEDVKEFLDERVRCSTSGIESLQ